MEHVSSGGCLHISVPREACYVRFKDVGIVRSAEIGRTARGEMMIADFDADGQIVGIELVGGNKPCQA
jgi:hypothetical protein